MRDVDAFCPNCFTYSALFEISIYSPALINLRSNHKVTQPDCDYHSTWKQLQEARARGKF